MANFYFCKKPKNNLDTFKYLNNYKKFYRTANRIYNLNKTQ